ncbi:protein ROLLING AND ERECT LEAF 2 [Salvia miltiorrhiza]|uniref:protein ROLLING AND ERECT LEAF 2 n=1 Tax=Salvia miltiorrhiza TaxID=226208 RepID=UPI0025ACECD0|nr:protein ROLLING AND ERECT LEAF 2 [Salvia miltiorrhiza]
MGCTQSKIENEETVNRCKERKQHMERAVTARNKFAAAHSAHAMSLKNTGAALSDFAQGEAIYPATAVAAASVASSTAIGSAAPPPPHPYENFPPPPPPPHESFPNTSPLQRAATMPEFAIPRPVNNHADPIMEEENEEDDESDISHSLKRRSKSSKSAGRGGISPPEPLEDEVLHQQRKNDQRDHDRERVQQQQQPPPPPSNSSSWDYFFGTDHIPGPTLADVEENSVEIEEMERKMLEERARRKEMEEKEKARAAKAEPVAEVVELVSELPPQPPPPEAAIAAAMAEKKAKQVVLPAEGKKKSVGNVNLVQIFVELDDCFLKASESAHDVSRMLEATRLHYHSNFADKRGNINHSERVMRVITWNRSFRGLANADDGVDDFDSEEHETHATVLDKMLAWEKKLYDEVKAGEQMKLEYQKKVASLNKLKKRSSNTDGLERMKAAVSHLHTRYIVDMQSMDSTVSEINRLRDEQLYPKLVFLVDAMATMWETIRIHNESQSKVVQALRYLDISQAPKETSEHHHERTRQLGGVVQEWFTNFSELMGQQKEYIKALNHWLKLNLIPIDTNWKEKVSSPGRPQNPPIQKLLQAWQEYLDKLPDEPARATINNFAAIIKTIWQYQEEELDYKNKCAEARKDLIRKTRDFETWYNKQMQKRSPADDMDPERSMDQNHIADRQLSVEAAKQKLEDAEESYQKQCIQVRDKSLMSLKSHLPELFRALSDFSLASSDMYSHLRAIAHSRSRSEVS